MDSKVFSCVMIFYLIPHIVSAVRIPPPPPPALPPPPLGCVDVIYSLIGCLSYIRNGSDLVKPSVGCCEGLLSILNTRKECFCEGLNSGEKFGVVLNLTSANALPSMCQINNITVAKCGTDSDSDSDSALPSAPSPSPKSSPPNSPSPSAASPQGTPATPSEPDAPPPESGDSGYVAPAPNANAPANKQSSASFRSIPYTAILACLAAISLSSF